MKKKRFIFTNHALHRLEERFNFSFENRHAANLEGQELLEQAERDDSFRNNSILMINWMEKYETPPWCYVNEKKSIVFLGRAGLKDYDNCDDVVIVTVVPLRRQKRKKFNKVNKE